MDFVIATQRLCLLLNDLYSNIVHFIFGSLPTILLDSEKKCRISNKKVAAFYVFLPENILLQYGQYFRLYKFSFL